jgi:tetratricopeptide (TPR) repeat protein
MKEKNSKKTDHHPRFSNLFAKGTKALQSGAVAKAINYLEQAQYLEPEHNDIALNLGGAYILSKKFKKAVQILEMLSKRDPHNAMVWTNLGAAWLGNPVLADDSDQQRAIAAFERALELNPVTPNVAYNLGLIYFDRKEFDRALHWFKKAVQANPNDRDARQYIAKLKKLVADGDIN